MPNKLLRDNNGNIIDIQQENLITLANTELIIVPSSTTAYTLQSGKYYDFGIRSLESESYDSLNLSLANISSYVPNYSFQVGAKEEAVYVTLPDSINFDAESIIGIITIPTGKTYHFNIWNNLCSISSFDIPQLPTGNPEISIAHVLSWQKINQADKYIIRAWNSDSLEHLLEITDLDTTGFDLLTWYPGPSDHCATPILVGGLPEMRNKTANSIMFYGEVSNAESGDQVLDVTITNKSTGQSISREITVNKFRYTSGAGNGIIVYSSQVGTWTTGTEFLVSIRLMPLWQTRNINFIAKSNQYRDAYSDLTYRFPEKIISDPNDSVLTY